MALAITNYPWDQPIIPLPGAEEEQFDPDRLAIVLRAEGVPEPTVSTPRQLLWKYTIKQLYVFLEGETLPEILPRISSLTAQLLEQCEEYQDDITLQFQTDDAQACSVVLPLALLNELDSPFFAALTESNWVEAKTGTITLHRERGFTGAAVLAFLCHVFNPHSIREVVCGANALDLLQISSFLELPDVSSVVEKFVINALSLDNTLSVLRLSHQLVPKPKLLYLTSRNFVVHNIGALIDTLEYKQLPESLQLDVQIMAELASSSPARFTGELDEIHSARELYSIMQEALEAQKERLTIALRRESEGTTSSYVQQALLRQQRRVERLEQFIQQQRELLQLQQELAQPIPFVDI